MRRRPIFLAAFVAVVALVVTALVIVLRNTPTTTLGKPESGGVAIPGYGGTKLSAQVHLPTGPGPHPLIILPGSWGAAADRYNAASKLFTDDGYIVIAYSQRGIGASGGKIDLGGDLTQRDESQVITWALAHEPADPNRIASLGLSYGAGISLLAAERDPRIKAVVAMSAWTNLLSSYFPNGTPSRYALQTLYGPTTVARLSSDGLKFYNAFARGDYAAAEADITAMSPSRSPITNVDALNRNHTAVMIANDYQDSYFPPAQLVTFFDKLTGPKQLELAVGDHGGQEFAGLNGLPDPVWTAALRWLDHYVAGKANGADTQPPVQLRDMTTGIVHTFASWPVTTAPGTYLGDGDTDSLTDSPAAAWSRAITAGVPTSANTAPYEVGVVPYRPLTGFVLATVSHTAAAVWSGPALTAQTTIAGMPVVHLSVTTSVSKATLFAHLYDVNAAGRAALITYAAYSIANAVPNTTTSIDITLEPIAWTVPAGHHLAVVIDTVDPKFATMSAPGQTVTLDSTPADPAQLRLPTE